MKEVVQEVKEAKQMPEVVIRHFLCCALVIEIFCSCQPPLCRPYAATVKRQLSVSNNGTGPYLPNSCILRRVTTICCCFINNPSDDKAKIMLIC